MDEVGRPKDNQVPTSKSHQQFYFEKNIFEHLLIIVPGHINPNGRFFSFFFLDTKLTYQTQTLFFVLN